MILKSLYILISQFIPFLTNTMVSIAVGLKASSTLQWEVMLAGANCINKGDWKGTEY